MPDLLVVIVAAAIGFVVGVLINLLADYLPGRRLHHEAITSPFASRSAAPPRPHFIPRALNAPDRPAPLYAWSGVLAWLTGRRDLAEGSFAGARWTRRIAVEIGTALIFGWVVTQYAYPNDWLFFGVCTPLLILIAVIDSEHRWILLITWLPLGLFTIAYDLFWPRLPLAIMSRGALTLFGVGLIFYILGIVVQRVRRVGRTVFGFGDVWLMGVSGLLVGWPIAGLALLIGVFCAGAASIVTVLENRGRSRGRRRNLAIPYAPYLVLGTAVMLYAPWLASSAMFRWLEALHR